MTVCIIHKTLDISKEAIDINRMIKETFRS